MADSTQRPPHRPRHRWRRAVRAVATAAALGLVAWIVVRFLLPEFENENASVLAAFRQISPGLVVAALICEAGSLAAVSGVTGTLLEWKIPYRSTLRIDLADLAANHALPGGGTTAAVVRFRLLTVSGVSPAQALSSSLLEAGVQNLVLFALFFAGILLSLTTLAGDAEMYGLAIGTGLVLIAVFVVAIWLLVHRSDAVVHLTARLGAHFAPAVEHGLTGLARTLTSQTVSLLGDRRRTFAALGYAAVNWALDAAALWLMLVAFGATIRPGPLLAAYGLAAIIALLPLTPGGLGLVEGVTVPALVAFGVAAPSALLGVLGWRVLEYWLPMPVGALCYLSLRVAWRRASPPSPGRPSR